jgi:penicillin-binding protein 1C
VSQLHRRVALDNDTGRPVCAPYPPGTRFDVYEFWPSDMLKLFREAGMPRRIPPQLPACATADPSDAPRIASPLRNVSYTLRASRADAIALDASAAGDVRQLFWFDGTALLAARAIADGALAWRPDSPGHHGIRVVDDHGRSAERDVEIEFIR